MAPPVALVSGNIDRFGVRLVPRVAVDHDVDVADELARRDGDGGVDIVEIGAEALRPVLDDGVHGQRARQGAVQHEREAPPPPPPPLRGGPRIEHRSGRGA